MKLQLILALLVGIFFTSHLLADGAVAPLPADAPAAKEQWPAARTLV